MSTSVGSSVIAWSSRASRLAVPLPRAGHHRQRPQVGRLVGLELDRLSQATLGLVEAAPGEGDEAQGAVTEPQVGLEPERLARLVLGRDQPLRREEGDREQRVPRRVVGGGAQQPPEVMNRERNVAPRQRLGGELPPAAQLHELHHDATTRPNTPRLPLMKASTASRANQARRSPNTPFAGRPP